MIGIFLVCPAIWPWLLTGVQNFLVRRNLFLPVSPTAWDHYFRDKNDRWAIVHLSETRRMGGWFGKNSHASRDPEPGHLYVEEVWELDAADKFVRKLPRSRGMLSRPGDYQ